MKSLHRLVVIGILTIFCLLTAFPSIGSAAIIRYDGPYEGKVIDAETGEPIKGAVVLGIWYRIHPNVAGWNSEFYDARETLTDENGDFSIPGLGLIIFSDIEPMNVLIFKAGYEQLGTMLWVSLKKDRILRKIVKWDKNKPLIPLSKISDKRRGRRPSRPYIPENKMKLLTEEINMWRIMIGVPPFQLRGED